MHQQDCGNSGEKSLTGCYSVTRCVCHLRTLQGRRGVDPEMGLRRFIMIGCVVIAFYYYQFEISANQSKQEDIGKSQAEVLKYKEIGLHWMAPFFRFFLKTLD